MYIDYPEFLTSQNGKRMISLGGYTFVCQTTMGQKARWWCSTHHKKQCRAVLHTLGDEIVYIRNEHNHAKKQMNTAIATISYLV
ncbi:hypothetical protein JYU34_004406 [Plutella xylostella]|uniref:FLYWCH-type domain-containing protein n=1 Tax=Plutella xylostella TaxID=51655 RepID=A0ABQ7QXW3_PLUXY|nr:hypothetical protein JYU34_004406 [Plutella xylostella]